jgi:hypothetical protein
MMNVRRPVLVLVVSVVASGSISWAQTGTARYVAPAGSDAGNDCTLAGNPCATIGHAVTVAGGGDIVIVAPGTYTEADIRIARDVTIRGAGANLTIIQAAPAPRVAATRVFWVKSAGAAFAGLTIRHGNLDAASGAALLAEFAQVRMTECVVDANCESNGGGGAVAVIAGTLTASRSTFTGNVADSGGSGGALEAVGATVELRDCVFEANRVVGGAGGALYMRGGDLTVMRSIFRRNASPSGAGGAMFVQSGGALATTARIEASVFHDNEAPSGTGSAVYLGDGSFSVINTTFSHNAAPGGQGGALLITQENATTEVTLDHVTVASNETISGSGGGVFNQGAHVRFKNVILAGNVKSAGKPSDCDGVFESLGNNLVGSADGCTLNRVAGAGPDLLGRDPLLAPLADNGGPTWTRALMPGSPAIDAGTCADADGRSVTIDQRGAARPAGAGCDIGAYETGGALPTTTPVAPVSTPVTTPTTPTPTTPAPTPAATPTAGADGPRACPRLRAPAEAIRAALANPSAVYGWQMLCNPNVPYHPIYNVRRVWLQLRNPNLSYHPTANDLIYGCGCR